MSWKPTEKTGNAGGAPELGTKNYWTEEQLAAELSVTTRTVRNWRNGRVFPYIKIGGCVRFDRAAVAAALARQTVQARAVA